MSFKKRQITHFSFGCSVPDVQTDSNGMRTVLNLSPSEFAEKHPPVMEEYTLTEELQSGVPIQEIPCGHILDDDSPNMPGDDEEILSALTSEATQE